jgi:protease secretion system membrane fusion protein
MVADSMASQADLKGQSSRALLAVAELQQRKIARQQDYRKEVESQLSEVSREVQADAEKLPAVSADLARTSIRATSDGQVVGLTVQSVGAVVQPGQKIMDIVPENEPLILESRIEPHLIDKVHAGLKADVRFASFSNTPQLVVEGSILSVSQDLLVDQATGAGYYLARLQLTEDGLKALGKRQMQPGMPAEVIIKTGERTLLTYLLKPLLKRMAASLKEE